MGQFVKESKFESNRSLRVSYKWPRVSAYSDPANPAFRNIVLNSSLSSG